MGDPAVGEAANCLHSARWDLRCPELTNAAAAFFEKQPFHRVDPFVDHFWKTFWSYDPNDGRDITLTREMERRIVFRLDEQVFMLWSRPSNFMNTQADADRMQRILKRQREVTPHQRFRDDLKATFEGCNWKVKDYVFADFADWLEETPSAAPAWRLFWQTSEELTLNTQDSAKPGDIHDLMHASAAPYVDAVTLDGRFLNYARQAAAKLMRADAAINYGGKLFRSFSDIVKHFS
jgi:hypothetical protein